MMTTSLWRNRHDRSNTKESLDPVNFAVSEGIVGVDWAVDTDPGESLNWADYEQRAEQNEYDDDEAWVRSLRAIHDHMEEGDLCYTRDAAGQFYLGRVTGSWRYETGSEYQRHALVNVRDCNWYRIDSPEETVPTELLESFGRGSVLQRIKEPRLLAFSQRLFELMDERKHYDIELPYTLDNWLSDDDLKDLLALHLQTDEDQFVIPSSVDQKPFLADGVTVNRISADRTLYQVQHKHDHLPEDAFKNDQRRIVYLQRDNRSRPNVPDNVEVLSLDDLKSVFVNQRDLLPRRLRIIGDILRERGSLKGASGNRASRTRDREEEESSRKAAGFTTRSVFYFVAGFLLGLTAVLTYAQWTGPAETRYGQQQRASLQEDLSKLRADNETLTNQRNDLRERLAELKEENESLKRTTSNKNSSWVNVRIRRNDTLSELLERFQGSQDQQDQVVQRNNIRNRDLIYTGSTLSFPTRNTVERNQMARN